VLGGFEVVSGLKINLAKYSSCWQYGRCRWFGLYSRL
jgi:hypothetical protein